MDLRERNSAMRYRHPWETVRSSFFTKLIKLNTPAKSLSALDLGAGDCWFAEQIINRIHAGSTVACCDVNFTDSDMTMASSNNLRRYRNPPNEKYDLVIMADVLEHIEDDREFLSSVVAPRIRDGGILLISVPAHQRLFSSHDTFLGHFRRYSRTQLLLLVGEQFEPVSSGYLFVSLALARFLQKRLKPIGGSDELGVGSWKHGWFITQVVTLVLHLDAKIGRMFNMLGVPIPGLTTWVVAVPRVDKLL